MKIYNTYPEPSSLDPQASGFRQMFPTIEYFKDQRNPHPRTPSEARMNRKLTKQIKQIQDGLN